MRVYTDFLLQLASDKLLLYLREGAASCGFAVVWGNLGSSSYREADLGPSGCDTVLHLETDILQS